MPCYVDEVFAWPIDATNPAARAVAIRSGGRWCHLWADTREELHALASRILVKREWFQDRKDFPHYDLTARKRAEAIRAGAVPSSLQDWLRRKSNQEEWRYRYEERL